MSKSLISYDLKKSKLYYCLTLFVLASLLHCVTLGTGLCEYLLSVRGITHYVFVLDLKR